MKITKDILTIEPNQEEAANSFAEANALIRKSYKEKNNFVDGKFIYNEKVKTLSKDLVQNSSTNFSSTSGSKEDFDKELLVGAHSYFESQAQMVRNSINPQNVQVGAYDVIMSDYVVDQLFVDFEDVNLDSFFTKIQNYGNYYTNEAKFRRLAIQPNSNHNLEEPNAMNLNSLNVSQGDSAKLEQEMDGFKNQRYLLRMSFGLLEIEEALRNNFFPRDLVQEKLNVTSYVMNLIKKLNYLGTKHGMLNDGITGFDTVNDAFGAAYTNPIQNLNSSREFLLQMINKIIGVKNITKTLGDTLVVDFDTLVRMRAAVSDRAIDFGGPVGSANLIQLLKQFGINEILVNPFCSPDFRIAYYNITNPAEKAAQKVKMVLYKKSFLRRADTSGRTVMMTQATDAAFNKHGIMLESFTELKNVYKGSGGVVFEMDPYSAV